MTTPDYEALLVAARQEVDRHDSETAEARAKLGALILEARDKGGLTVPRVADVLGWSEANVFRVSAQAKKQQKPAGSSPA